MNTATAAVADLAAVKLIPLALITTRDQVRTRNGFDKESLRQLADSIQQYGILQPIVVQRDPEADAGFIVLYGHRRHAAAKLAKLERIPAMVVDQEPTAVTEVQLTENLQREGLNLADTADAVRKLFRMHKNASEVAKRVNKSRSWVSKHLALTDPKTDDRIRQLVESDLVQDVEIVGTLNQIAKLKTDAAAKELDKLLTAAGAETLSRKVVRDSLAKLQVAATNDEEADDDGEDDDQAETPGEGFDTIKVFVFPGMGDQFKKLGGQSWLIDQIKKAWAETQEGEEA